MQQSSIREGKWKSILRQFGSLFHCEKYDHKIFYRNKRKNWKQFRRTQWNKNDN